MFNSTATKIISLITAISLTGCASANTYSRVEAEPLHVAANYKGEIPQGIVEDSMRVDGSAPLFNSSTYKKIESAASTSKDLAVVQQKIRDAVCDGSNPRVQPKLTVHLVLNKPTKGEPLDVVAEKNRIFIAQTKIFLRKFWLDEASRTDLMGKTYNNDYEDYERHMVQTGMERRSSSSRISVGVPFITVSTAKDVESYFANARAVPTLRPIEETGPTQWFPARSYLSVAMDNHYFVLSSKVTDILLAVWGFNTYGTEMQSNIVRGVQFKPETTFQYFGISDGFNFRNSMLYAISGNSWKLSDGSVARPLVKTVMDDLAVLKTSFSWRIPKDDIERLFHVTDSVDLQYFGYNPENGSYSAAYALEHQSYLWSQMLENQTEVTQTSKEDGSVVYELRPSFTAFCKWAVPTTSLSAQ